MKVLLGITGSIAAYKAATLVRLMVKAGHEVKVIATQSACDFITPLTLSTLSKNPVFTALYDKNTGEWVNHVALGNWADIMIIAPATANTLSKMAYGQADNLLLTTYLSATCPVYVAPAMDRDMYLHPSTAGNIATLRKYGNHIIPPTEGELASGLEGIGRMAEPEEILAQISLKKNAKAKQLAGKKVLVTAGPTYEAIDPVRFIGNHSSGKMGFAIAEKLADMGAEVFLVCGAVNLKHTHKNIHRQDVRTASEMYAASIKLFAACDIAILAAAVSDFKVAEISDHKIKKSADTDGLQLQLVKTQDILASLGKMKNRQILVGFSLESHHGEAYAREKLERKNCDLMILNSLEDAGAGFAHDTNKITIIAADGDVRRYPLKTKQEVAKDICEYISAKYFS